MFNTFIVLNCVKIFTKKKNIFSQCPIKCFLQNKDMNTSAILGGQSFVLFELIGAKST